ncbi:MAG: hypothetical protein ACXABY_09745 [Candidatus Thorarchaeota archaeon]|jgi:hypothetical protein
MAKKKKDEEVEQEYESFEEFVEDVMDEGEDEEESPDFGSEEDVEYNELPSIEPRSYREGN